MKGRGRGEKRYSNGAWNDPLRCMGSEKGRGGTEKSDMPPSTEIFEEELARPWQRRTKTLFAKPNTKKHLDVTQIHTTSTQRECILVCLHAA